MKKCLIQYRIHQNNKLGDNKKIKSKIFRIYHLFNGDFVNDINNNLKILYEISKKLIRHIVSH